MAVQVLHGTIVLPDRLLERGWLVVEDGLIREVGQSVSREPAGQRGEWFIAPGFIDVHLHGLAGADTMDAREESLAAMARRLTRHGVTGFLPTTLTAGLDSIVGAVEQIHLYQRRQAEGGWPQSRVLGAHLEGPWIARECKGAQDEEYIALPTKESVDHILDSDGHGAVKIVSLAPELAGAAEVIAILRRRGVYVSLGHTGATCEEALRAFALGASQVTHCFNAMSGLHHRRPGLAAAALVADQVSVELIADGIHVHPAVMRLAIRAKGREKVMLISDSVAAAGLPEGRHMSGGREVYVHSDRVCLPDGTLAGSTLTLDRAVANLVTMCNVSLPDAVYMAAAAPAEAIGLGDRKGKILAGYDADLVILDRRLQPRQVLVAGKRAFPGSGM